MLDSNLIELYESGRMDKDLGLNRQISRRQFCQGTGVALTASLAPWVRTGTFSGSPEIGGYYPPCSS